MPDSKYQPWSVLFPCVLKHACFPLSHLAGIEFRIILGEFQSWKRNQWYHFQWKQSNKLLISRDAQILKSARFTDLNIQNMISNRFWSQTQYIVWFFIEISQFDPKILNNMQTYIIFQHSDAQNTPMNLIEVPLITDSQSVTCSQMNEDVQLTVALQQYHVKPKL